ncbi:hypothetical protein GUJ93_ZPchr0010g10127 [Zizania palustris]|uniref:Uncharacterized protein n=1 Tax=Zizania palustris TaxID=103762 RepID=A0A8J5W8G0_ZIZPA|nr:hypothetical protein GUJ93_ZPchr0010g10127 [Zizania palustris]
MTITVRRPSLPVATLLGRCRTTRYLAQLHAYIHYRVGVYCVQPSATQSSAWPRILVIVVSPTLSHASSMAASVRGLPLFPPVRSPCASCRLSPSPQSHSVDAASEGAPCRPNPVEVVGIGRW